MRQTLTRAMTVRRMMPSRKQSGVGVCSLPSCTQEDVGAGGLGDWPKSRAPFWKIEHGRDGEDRWVEAKAKDAAL